MTSKGFQTSALIESIRAGRVSGVINALDAGADIEEPDIHGNRGLPLRTACFAGNEAIVRELLSRGANPNVSASDGPSAPLRLALRGGHKEISALLLQRGAQPPSGVSIDPSIFVLEVAPLAGEALAPRQPDGAADNVIEFTRTDIGLLTEDHATAESCGTETKALSMNLLFLDENDLQADLTIPDRTDAPSKAPTA
jgi:ankyrin repeat protein